MHATLITLTFAEIAVVIAVVAFYLLMLAKSLNRSSANLVKVRDGVRVVEGHCAPIGPVVTTVNAQLKFVSGKLATLAELAETITAPPPPGGRRT